MSLRVCLVSSAYRPWLSGVGEHVHNLALGLRNRGHDVRLLTASYPGLDTGFCQHPFPVTRVGRSLILPAHGGHFTLPVGAGLPGAIRRFLRTGRFDVVHCHGIFPPEMAYWAALHARAPVVVTFHTVLLPFPQVLGRAFRLTFPELQRRVKVRIAVSRVCARAATEWFPGRYRVIPNGVDTVAFNPAVRPCPGNGKSAVQPLSGRAAASILYVSRLDRRKGLPVLLRAMPGVLGQVPHARLLVVGSGPLEPSCREDCRRLGIEHAVEFCGALRPEELPDRYAGCTVFAAPAQGRESMGIVLIEAMACGRPVVASNIPGYDEVIENGRTGILVSPRDPDAWSAALVSVLRSGELRSRLGRAALERAGDFAWPVVTRQVEEAYREALR